MSRKKLTSLFLVLATLLTLVSAASAAPPAQEELTYTVKLGDNLWTLAEKYLGSGPAYWAIVGATNAEYQQDSSFANIANPNLIHPGWKLLIPSAEDAQRYATLARVERGGTMILGYSEQPGANLNPYTGAGYMYFHPWQQPFLQGLVAWDPDGNPVPSLAAEVPTLENGGVSEDGKSITYRLRSGVKWADGESFTCDDVRFTIEALKNPASVLHAQEGVEYIEEVQCEDDLTAVFKFKEYYAPWVTVPEFMLPEHVLSQYPDMNDVPWNSEPFGTGPFMVTEHVPDDHIVFEPNPYYWEEGKPYFDKVIMQFIPDMSVGLERFAAGEIDAYTYTEEDKLPQVRTISGYELVKPQGNDYNSIKVNLSPSSGPHMGDPNYPNPVLADVKVRRAIDMAIDKQAINDRFRAGESFAITGAYFVGQFAAPALKPRPHDPEGAQELLEEAGWVDTDGDGVRECHGCEYAEEGAPLSLKLVAPSEIKSGVLMMQYVQSALQEVGFDAQVEAVTVSLLWAPRDAGGIMPGGAFDLCWSGDRCSPDPQLHYASYFHSSNAECATMPWCTNWSRYVDPDMDALLESTATEKDPEERKRLMQQIIEKVFDEVPEIYTNSRSRMVIVKPDIKGITGPYDKANGFAWPTTYLHYAYRQTD
jgi:peptide/nickel transport system substrate-binding protein